MPRQPRLHSPAGLYHVILRGNNRARLFFSRPIVQLWGQVLHYNITSSETEEMRLEDLTPSTSIAFLISQESQLRHRYPAS